MAAKKVKTIAPTRKPPTTSPHRRGIRGGLVALVLIVGALVAAVGLIGGQGSASAAPPVPSVSPDSMATVETVAGQALPVREYELFLSQDRAETFAYFRQHYGVADSSTFWTTAHGGQTPTDYLKRVSLADATKALVQQVLAMKYGVVTGFTYAGFLHAWQAQNASRASALASHQVIYGPTSYSESDYFTYVSEQISEQLQTTLTSKGVVKVTDAALESYYNAHKSQFNDSKGDDQQVGPKAAGPSTAPALVGFAQAKPVVEEYYVQAVYTAFVAQQTKQATTYVDQSVLAAITIN